MSFYDHEGNLYKIYDLAASCTHEIGARKSVTVETVMDQHIIVPLA
jgi:hypothetical protein